jgi:hypothetical protein
MQAVQSSGDAPGRSPAGPVPVRLRGSVVSGQINLKTGGEGGDPDEKAKYPKVTGLAKNKWNG